MSVEKPMLIEAIFEYLGSLGGPDRGMGKLWIGVVAGLLLIAVLIAVFWR